MPSSVAKVLRRPAWIAASPLALATWTKVWAVALENENDGVFGGASTWTDSMWLPIANVTRDAVTEAVTAGLCAWEGDSLCVLGVERHAGVTESVTPLSAAERARRYRDSKRNREGVTRRHENRHAESDARPAVGEGSAVTESVTPAVTKTVTSRHVTPPSPTPPSPDLSLSSPRRSDPDLAGARVAAPVPIPAGRPLSGHSLCVLFGRVRSREVGGLEWQAARVAEGKASDMADMINAMPGLAADVEPTMVMLFRRAKDGREGKSSAQILRDPSFAFGTWCSSWTALREELHGRAPTPPAAAPDAGVKPWVAAERAQEQQQQRDRMERRNKLAELTQKLANAKAAS